jgi:hypothetical protein
MNICEFYVTLVLKINNVRMKLTEVTGRQKPDYKPHMKF